jgi:hypothetical protein
MRRAATRPSSPVAAEGLFDPVEEDLLRRYFGLKARFERCQLIGEPEEVDSAVLQSPAARDAAFGVRLETEALDASHPDPALARAVARICLHVVGRRPAHRWGASPLDTLARAACDETPANVPVDPPLLFEIDWAMLSWPESYHAVLVPGFDRYVVVKSSCEEGCGGPWLALGWFRRRQDAVREVGRIVASWWRFQAEHEQARWEYFLRAGTISQEVASAWADEVWPLEEEEDPSADEDDKTDGDGLDEPAAAACLSASDLEGAAAQRS